MLAARELAERSIQQEVTRASSRIHARRKLKGFATLWVVGVIGGVLVVNRYATADQYGYAIDRLQSQYVAARALNEALTAEVATLSSPDRLVGVGTRMKIPTLEKAFYVPAVTRSTGPAARPRRVSAWSRAWSRLLHSLGAVLRRI